MKLKELIETKGVQSEEEHIHDLAMTILGEIEKDAEGFYGKKGKPAYKNLTAYLQALSDNELDKIATHPLIYNNVEDNYDYADDTGATSHIDAETLFSVVKHLQSKS